jgi:hypothetical protein
MEELGNLKDRLKRLEKTLNENAKEYKMLKSKFMAKEIEYWRVKADGMYNLVLCMF